MGQGQKNPEYKYQDDEWWKREWWIIRNEIKEPEFIFIKIFTEVGAKEIEEKWYKEIKIFIDITVNELNDSLKGV